MSLSLSAVRLKSMTGAAAGRDQAAGKLRLSAYHG